MEKIKWSNEQLAAIEANGSNYLISAGAGSGKTEVLKERVYHLVKNCGASISRFLILTFTNAAAANMKKRIRNSFLEDESLAHLAIEVENSNIETFDAFNLFLVKKYSVEAGVSRDIKPIETSLLIIKKRKVLDEIFEEQYDSKDQDFLNMILAYCDKDDSIIKDFVLRISDFADLSLDKDAFYNDFIKEHFDTKKLEAFVDEKFKNQMDVLNQIRPMVDELGESEYTKKLEKLIDHLLESKDYDSLYYASKDEENYPYPKKSKSDVIDDELKDKIKDLYGEAFPKVDYGTKQEIIDSYMSNQKTVEKLLELARTLDERIMDFKKANNLYTFNDISRFSLDLLNKPSILAEVKNSFDYIMVDEYQDTSDSQEKILELLGRDNVYMVGDIKQSIYRFRNANCNNFQEKYDRYKNNNGGKEIDLNTSFRSRREVVNIVNDIFSQLMKPEYNIIDYSNGHHFGFGLDKYNTEFDKNADYNLRVINKERDENDPTEEEAKIIATDILNKVAKQEAFDSKPKVMRKSQFKDFAVLIDRKKYFMTYKKVFNDLGIPVKIIGNEPFVDSEIAYVSKDLLVIFNFLCSCGPNPIFDKSIKHAYASLARSFLCNEKDQDIYDAISKDALLNTEIFKKIDEVVRKYRHASVFKVLNTLYTDFDFYNKVIHIGNVSSNIHKAELFLHLARSFDDMGYSVEDFVTYFDDLLNYDTDIDFSEEDGDCDAVTLITIHKSKGLEYPFCYFPNFNSEFFDPNDSTSYLINNKYGIILPITGNKSQTSLFNKLFKDDAKAEDLEEKIRLLYVALTRARETITIINTFAPNEKPVTVFKKIRSFGQMIKFINLDQKFATAVPELDKNRVKVEQEEPKPKEVEVKTVKMNDTTVGSIKRASKEVVEDVDDSLLEFGTRLHYLLEVADYETKDTSFVKESYMRRYVNNVLNCGLFDGVKNEQVLHEYSFFDEEHNTNGIIDCMVVLDDEVRIIDFKLKNISDEKYNKQLNIYADYVKLITKKSLKLYLISAITGEVKEIERT